MKSPVVLSIAVLSLGGVAVPATAQEEASMPLLNQGNQELSVSGRLEIVSSDELDYDLEGSYGYFFRDGWEVGAQIVAADFGGRDRLEIAGFTEYNFNRNSNVVPYVGGAIGIVTADFGENIVVGSPLNDDDGLVFDVEGGVKFFIRPYMAISVGISFKFATEDVFETFNEIEDNLTSFRIGMRYYY